MRPKDAIMVNDMMLCEYLRDNESIEDEIIRQYQAKSTH